MPTKPIDYSNVSFYKLCCNDPSITDIYVGHTTNFTKRKNEHKSRCNNKNNAGYNVYVYHVIRDTGGFDNWSMIELCTKPCENKRDAERIERQYIEDLSASLNKILPTRTQNEWKKDNIEEVKEKRKEYYEKRKEEILNQKKQYRELHKEDRKKYRELHKDEIKEKKKQYYEEHKEEIKEKKKQYYEEHKEEINEKKKQYYQQKKLKENV